MQPKAWLLPTVVVCGWLVAVQSVGALSQAGIRPSCPPEAGQFLFFGSRLFASKQFHSHIVHYSEQSSLLNACAANPPARPFLRLAELPFDDGDPAGDSRCDHNGVGFAWRFAVQRPHSMTSQTVEM